MKVEQRPFADDSWHEPSKAGSDPTRLETEESKNAPADFLGVPNPRGPSVTNLRVLLLDDEDTTRRLFSRVLESEGAIVQAAGNIAEARALHQGDPFDLMLVDVYLGTKENGLDFVKEVRRADPAIGVIVMSKDESDKVAEQAAAVGADDFLLKPFDPKVLAFRARRAADIYNSRRTNKRLEEDLRRGLHETLFPGGIVTNSDTMRALLKVVDKAARRDIPVFIFGESGTGKELIARTIHEQSERRSRQFVDLNCAALPPSLVESELFGHERGAFTGATGARVGRIEQAHGGTLFLDEIGELPLEIQPKLLRALQDKRITRVGGTQSIACDFRLVTATNRDLLDAMRSGKFREDLFFRIVVLPIKLPPLRERPEDIQILLDHMLKQEPGPKATISVEAQALLHRYRWPGNVRELKNFAQAVSIYSEDNVVTASAVRHYFGSRLGSTTGSLAIVKPSSPNLQPTRTPTSRMRLLDSSPSMDSSQMSRSPSSISLRQALPPLNAVAAQDSVPVVPPLADAVRASINPTALPQGHQQRPIRKLEEIERDEIVHALKRMDGNVADAAHVLGMGRATLYKYLKRHRLGPMGDALGPSSLESSADFGGDFEDDSVSSL